MFVHNLEEEITYTFSVRAQTLDYGPPVVGNVTTGPQPGSPARPRDLILSKTISAVKLTWTNGNSGKGNAQTPRSAGARRATEVAGSGA